LIHVNPAPGRPVYLAPITTSKASRVMTKPVPDKAEVAIEYPDKLYIGTFAQSARFDAHLDEAGISLSLHRIGPEDERKSVRMHFHYALFAEILRDLAMTVNSVPADDILHRQELRDAAKALYAAFDAKTDSKADAGPSVARGEPADGRTHR
jgi:hypothetical protein